MSNDFSVMLTDDFFSNTQMLGWFWPAGLCFAVSFGSRYQFSIWAAKRFAQELSYWQSNRDRWNLISFFQHLSSVSSREIELTCYYKREDKPDVWKFAFQSIARVCQLKRATTFVWLTRENKVTWSSCCIQNLGKFKAPIFVVWGIQSSRYCTEMNYRTKNELHWACTAKGAYKCENDNLAVTAGPPFFRFL